MDERPQRDRLAQRQQLAALAELHRVFAAEAIEYWLFGGWAVDFHARAVTRPHGDLDLAVRHADLPRIISRLDAAGWRPAPNEEDGSAAYERDAVRLELAFLARDEAGVVYTPLSDGRAEWAPGAFEDDVAMLDGVEARLISLRALQAEKSAHREDPAAAAKDQTDLATLTRVAR